MRKNVKTIFQRVTAISLAASLALGGNAWTGVSVSGVTASAASIDESKVLALSFEDNLTDSSGKGNNGTASGTVSYAEGVKGGKCLHLTGAGYLDLGTSGDLQPEKMTVSFWLKAPSNGLTGEQLIMWNKGDGSWDSDGWYMGSASDSRPIEVSLGKSTSAPTGQPYKIFVSGNRSEFFPKGEWVHIVVSYDSATKQGNIYRNGVKQTVGTEYDEQVGVVKATSDKKWLGCNSPKYGGKATYDIDEYEIFSQCATDDEALSLYTKNGGVIDYKSLIESDVKALSVPETTTTSLTLPVAGTAGGSKIVWTSSDASVIAVDGIVNRPSDEQGNKKVTLTATLTNGGETVTKTFEVTVIAKSDMAGLEQFSVNEVTLTDNYEVNAFQKDVNYLTSIDVDRMLAGFRETAAYAAGYDANKRKEFMKEKTRYAGWEDSLIGSHTMGHYLTAMAQASANANISAEDKAKVDSMLNELVSGLKECQDLTKGSAVCKEGYIFGATLKNTNNLEAQFDNVEANKANIFTEAWVPWYTMHKILAGLVDVYNFTGNKTALDVATSLGDWVYNRSLKWSDAVQATVLNIEYGGMNDALYELYKITKNENHAVAAHKFDEIKLFEKIKAGTKNAVDGIHANTTIPKFLGALNRYRALGEKEKVYLEYAEAFWDYVVNHHCYITGGNSENEHFGADDVLDAERTDVNCETCNTYNMLKMSRELFKITGDQKYADYYENTIINAILSSQNPETGMMMYFQPMASGYQKVYSTEYNSFWCCTGSGMENFTKLNDSIYYKKGNKLIVTQYVGSNVTWADKNVKVTQETDLTASETAKFTVSTIDGSANSDVSLRLRIPDWAAATPKIEVNGANFEYQPNAGYATVGPLKNGDVVTINLPMETRAYNLPDGENTYAFKYGPFVLSAKLGTSKQGETSHGVQVSKASTKAVSDDRIVIKSAKTVEGYMKDINKNLVKADGKLEFSLSGTDKASYVFVPHYSQYKESYGIYWKYSVDTEGFASDQILADKRAARNEAAKIDEIQTGYGQYEIGLEEKDSVGSTSPSYRYAKAGGYFRYEMRVDESGDNYLLATFAKEDDGKKIKISVGNKVIFDGALDSKKAEIANEIISDSEKENFYQIKIKVEKSVISENVHDYTKDGATIRTVSVKFEAAADSDSAKLYNWLYMRKAFSTSNSLTSMTSNDITLKQDGKAYTATVPYSAEKVKIIFNIEDKNGYVALNGNAVKEGEETSVALTGKETKISVQVFAQDFETASDYTLTITKDYSGLDLTKDVVYKFGFEDKTDGAVAVTKASVPAVVANPAYTYGNGANGKAIRLDGTYGLKFGDASKLGKSYTISFWMNPDALGGAVDPTIAAGTFSPEYWLNLTFDAKIWSNNGSYIETPAANAYETGKWQQVALSVDGNKAGSADGTVKASLYLNGALISEGNIADGIMTNTGAALYFGVNAWDNYFKGYLDEVMMFNRALTGAEIQGIADKAVTTDNLVGSNGGNGGNGTGDVSVKLNKSKATLYTGKASNSVTVNATVAGTSKTVSWKSSKPKVASVTKTGKTVKIKAVGKGTATITATVGNIKKTVKVTVKNPKITVKKGKKKVSSKLNIKKKKSVKLTITTSPKKSGSSLVKLKGKDKKVLTASLKGGKLTIKGKKKGKVTLTVKSGKGKKKLTVTVK